MCLPFGLCSAPWETLKPALATLRQKGVKLIAYMDGTLLLEESREIILNHLEGLIYLLINKKKSVLNPAQALEFLGLTVDSLTMELCLPSLKIKSIRAEARKIVRLRTTTARQLARLLGMVNATSCVIPPAPLFCRHLQMALSNTLEENSQSYEAQVTLPKDCLEELEWWDTPTRANGMAEPS